MPPPRSRPALRAALLSLLCLPTGLAVAFVAMRAIGAVAPALQERVGPPLFFAVVGVCAAAAGAAWGRLVTGRAAAAIGGAIAFGAASPAAVWGLTFAETALQLRAQERGELPMHLVFGAIFPAATALVVLVTTLGVALGAGRRARALPVALRCALAAGVAFAVVDVAFDLAGMRVGAPDAEARLTMLVVTAAGLVAATLAGGAALGRSLWEVQ